MTPLVLTAAEAETLCVLTALRNEAWWRRQISDGLVTVQTWGVSVRHDSGPSAIRWVHLSVQEAVEALVSAGRVPPDALDPSARRRWWCVACRGTGESYSGYSTCAVCGDYGYTSGPADVLTAAVWSFAGLDTLQNAEELAEVIAPGMPPAWRVVSGDEVNEVVLQGQAMVQAGTRAKAAWTGAWLALRETGVFPFPAAIGTAWLGLALRISKGDAGDCSRKMANWR